MARKVLLSYHRLMRPIENRDGRAEERASGEGASLTQKPDFLLDRFVIPLLLLLAVFTLAYHTLGTRTIEGTDPAHTIMDGLYFRDLLTDVPHNPISYTLNYYRQYPALGLLFWPPMFPFVLGMGFLIGGLDIRVAHWCLFGFSFVMVLMAYWITRKTMSRAAALIAALLIVTTPIVGQEVNVLMREIPALAFALAAVYVYLRFVESPSWKRAIALAVLGAAALYTKQTVLFVYPALAIDALVNRRALLHDRRLWSAVGLFVVLVAPLVAFTLGVSKVNVEQSLGSDPNLNMMGVGRWNLAAWMFYPRQLVAALNPIVLVSGLAAFVYAFRRPDFLRRNVLWFGWVMVWLAIFSWILAKEKHHAILWMPGWCILAVAMVADLAARAPRWKALPAVFVIPLMLGGWQVMNYHPSQFAGVEPVVKAIMSARREGNLMYFGRYRQPFVPFVRIHDQGREVFTLQGDDVTASSRIEDACRDYRVRYVIAERDSTDFQAVERQIRQSPAFAEIESAQVHPSWTAPVDLLVFRYDGQLAAHMKSAPLRSRFVTAHVNDIVKTEK